MIRAYRILPLAALLSLVLVQPASAQQDQAKLYVVTYVDVFPQGAADTNKWLHEFAADSRKDPGSVRFEVLRDVERSNHFTIVEVWQTRQAYEAHLGLEHTRKFRENLQKYLGSPFDERLYHNLE
ncbi:MAG TPA: putative quinol monooxygenase [Bryobacteraceae bacterium]|nr:putative quinol monooxygenase [Bryobacteraceae bacterium]